MTINASRIFSELLKLSQQELYGNSTRNLWKIKVQPQSARAMRKIYSVSGRDTRPRIFAQMLFKGGRQESGAGNSRGRRKLVSTYYTRMHLFRTLTSLINSHSVLTHKWKLRPKSWRLSEQGVGLRARENSSKGQEKGLPRSEGEEIEAPNFIIFYFVP